MTTAYLKCTLLIMFITAFHCALKELLRETTNAISHLCAAREPTIGLTQPIVLFDPAIRIRYNWHGSTSPDCSCNERYQAYLRKTATNEKRVSRLLEDARKKHLELEIHRLESQHAYYVAAHKQIIREWRNASTPLQPVLAQSDGNIIHPRLPCSMYSMTVKTACGNETYSGLCKINIGNGNWISAGDLVGFGHASRILVQKGTNSHWCRYSSRSYLRRNHAIISN